LHQESSPPAKKRVANQEFWVGLNRRRQSASNGPEGTAIIQRRKSSEQVPRMAKSKARILNREICEPREQNIPNAGLELARLGWIWGDSLGFGGKTLTAKPMIGSKRE
jgi:hypothetical protein